MGTEEKRGKTFRSSTDENLRHLPGITKPDKEKNLCIREKTGAQNIKGNKTVPEKVATTRAEDGHK